MTIRKLALVAIPAVLATLGTSSIRVVAQVPGPADAGPVVVTKDGPVRGLFANGVNAYLGIPYAAPPVGDLRWRPPAPPAHHGLIDSHSICEHVSAGDRTRCICRAVKHH